MSVTHITGHALQYSNTAANDYAAYLKNMPLLDGSARCAETDPEAFFPEKGETPRDAKRVCNDNGGCPVKDQCLEYALEHGERYGVWGGLSERERRKVALERQRGQDAA